MLPKIRSTRKNIAAAVIFAGALVATTGCGGSTEATNGQVVAATYAGPVGDAFQSVYFDDFTAETGIQVVQTPADTARYVSMSESGSSDWDTIDVDGYAVADWIKKGIVQELAPEVPRSDMIEPEFADYAAGGYTQSFLMAYRVSAFDTAPQTWEDFWDTEKFPGKRGWPGGSVGTVEAALMADGVPADDLYPLDFDRGFKKLDEIRPALTVYDSYSALTQGLQAGSVDMALLPNGRATGLAKQDPDIAVQWNENIFYPWTGFTISKGAPNAEGMNKLLAKMQDPKLQAKFAELTSYGPTLTEAYDLIPEEVAKDLPGTEEHRAVAATVDTGELASQTDEYIERYSQWLAR